MVAINTGGHSIQVSAETSAIDGGNLCPQSSVVGDSQISLIWCRRHLIATYDTVDREL